MRIDPSFYSPAIQSGAKPSQAQPAQLALASGPASASTNNGDKVSLSNAGRALAQQAQQAGVAGEKILGDLTRQTLSSLGITSSADALGAKIEFDSFTYHAKSSTSLSASHSRYTDQNGSIDSASLEFHSEQATEITGKGRITTADGRTFEFESQLQVHSKQDFTLSEQSSSEAIGSEQDSNLQNIQALRGQHLRIADNSPLLSIIDDILQQIRDGHGAAAAPTAQAPQGIAIGEPSPNSPNSANNAGAAPANDIFNLEQLNAGANKIAQQLKQLQQFSQQGYPSPQLAVAA